MIRFWFRLEIRSAFDNDRDDDMDALSYLLPCHFVVAQIICVYNRPLYKHKAHLRVVIDTDQMQFSRCELNSQFCSKWRSITRREKLQNGRKERTDTAGKDNSTFMWCNDEQRWRTVLFIQIQRNEKVNVDCTAHCCHSGILPFETHTHTHMAPFYTLSLF